MKFTNNFNDIFRAGYVITIMIAATVVMKANSVMLNIKPVHHKNSHAKISNASAHNIDAMEKTIVEIIQMKLVVRKKKIARVPRDNLLALTDNVSREMAAKYRF